MAIKLQPIDDRVEIAVFYIELDEAALDFLNV